jgi:hypothetical protein
MIDNGGAYSFFGSVGCGVYMPVTSIWSLTPSLRVGFGDSQDLAVGGCFASPALTSYLRCPTSECVVSMTNMIAYYASLPCHIGGVNLDYHLYNTSFKNGVSLASKEGTVLCSRKLQAELSFVDTYFSGSHLYINHYDEIGLSLFVSRIDPKIFYDSISLGLSYQFGQKSYKGYYVNASYKF